MEVRTVIQLLVKLKLMGIEIDGNGKIQRKLVNFTLVGLILVALLVPKSYFIYIHMSSIKDLDFNAVLYYALFESQLYTLPFMYFVINRMFIKIKDLDFTDNAKMTVGRIIGIFGSPAFLLVGFFLGPMQEFGVDLVKDILCLVLIIMSYISMVLYLLTLIMMTTGLKQTCSGMLLTKSLSLDDISKVTELYNRLKSALGFGVLFNYAIGQVYIVSAIYMVLIAKDVPAVMMMTCGAIMFLVVIIVEAETIYLAREELVSKGRSDAVVVTRSFKEFLQLRDGIDELEATGPITGLGFVDINQGLVNSMLATSLTYIIALIQMQSILNPN